MRRAQGDHDMILPLQWMADRPNPRKASCRPGRGSLQSGVRERPGRERGHDLVGGGFSLVGWIDDQVPLVDAGAGKLRVHVSCGGFVREAVAVTGGDTSHTLLNGWQEDDVLEAVQAGCYGEVGEEPWADDAVVDRGECAGGEPSCSRRRCLGDDGVLAVGFL